MIREFHLADALTLANAACGVAAGLCAMLYMGSHSSAPSLTPAGLTPAPPPLRSLGRACRALAAHAFCPGPGARFACRHHLVRAGTGDARFCRGPSGNVGLAGGGIFRPAWRGA